MMLKVCGGVVMEFESIYLPTLGRNITAVFIVRVLIGYCVFTSLPLGSGIVERCVEAIEFVINWVVALF